VACWHQVAACGAGQQLLQTFLQDYLLGPWKALPLGLLQLELPQQHGAVYDFIDCASWVITLRVPTKQRFARA
jgi:hypothetical protein